MSGVLRKLRTDTLPAGLAMFFEGLRIDLYAKTFTAGVKRTIQAADVAMDHNLAALHGNDARRHLHHGFDRQQIAEVDVQVADHDLMSCRPGGQTENFIKDCSDTAAVSVRGRTLGDRTEPDPCDQMALPVTEVFDPETIAGLVSRDESQGFSNQGRRIEQLPVGFSIEFLISHASLLMKKGHPLWKCPHAFPGDTFL